MANENDWLVTAAEVGAETTQTTVAIDGLDAVFASCTSFTPAQQSAWASFKQQYDQFIAGVNATMFGGISWAWQSSILSQVRGWQATVAGWQAIAASQCAYNGPGPYVNKPPPPANDTLWTVVKWGGIAALGAWAALTVAPIVAGTVARAKIVGAATKRVYGRARGRQNPVQIGGNVEVGTIGDINLGEYDGGLVMRREDGTHFVEWVYAPTDDEDFDSPRARWEVYRVDIDGGPPDWPDYESVAQTNGESRRKLLKMFYSTNPVTRALAFQSIANHDGWRNLDDYPLRLKRVEVERRYGIDLGSGQENPVRA